jgi:hypothetical protein
MFPATLQQAVPTDSHALSYVSTELLAFHTAPQNSSTEALVSPNHKGIFLLRNVGNYSHLDKGKFETLSTLQ